MQSSLIDSGIAEGRTVYHPNALAPEDYASCFEPGEYVLYVGRLSAEKGLLTLLSAFEQTDIPLRIAGTGPLDAEILSRIQARGLNVRMEGYCAGERLAALYRNAAFTVLPSEWYENASMAILESFAYGKPVLASNIGGNPELIIDGVSGRLFSSGSVEELVAIAREMWANKDELRSMGMCARGFIETQFNRKRRISNLLTIYGDVSGRVSPK